MIKYPKNIYDWFSDGRDKEFSMWAFGCEQPRDKMFELWDKLHPEFPMKPGDTLYLCICKMNYIFKNLIDLAEELKKET
jgi:hypothetical protein